MKIYRVKKVAAIKIVLKNKELESTVKEIKLKWIMLNQLKWILDIPFRILCQQYQPMQLYFMMGFSLPPTYPQLLYGNLPIKKRLNRLNEKNRSNYYLLSHNMQMNSYFLNLIDNHIPPHHKFHKLSIKPMWKLATTACQICNLS